MLSCWSPRRSWSVAFQAMGLVARHLVLRVQHLQSLCSVLDTGANTCVPFDAVLVVLVCRCRFGVLLHAKRARFVWGDWQCRSGRSSAYRRRLWLHGAPLRVFGVLRIERHMSRSSMRAPGP